jgi:sugar phosphate isomerase/epimerase
MLSLFQRVKNMKTIIYAANECGYVVQVLEGNKIIHEYRADNSRYDSQQSVPLDSNSVESLQTLQKYAKESALELADEYKIHPSNVDFDADLYADLFV